MKFYNRSGWPLAMETDDPRMCGEVCVYKKLTVTKTIDGPKRNLWSITDVKPSGRRGLLIGYADQLVLTGCRAFVDEPARKRIESGAYREVCAWFIGRVHFDLTAAGVPGARVTFHPHERGEFYRTDNGEPVRWADAILFGHGGNAWLK